MERLPSGTRLPKGPVKGRSRLGPYVPWMVVAAIGVVALGLFAVIKVRRDQIARAEAEIGAMDQDYEQQKEDARKALKDLAEEMRRNLGRPPDDETDHEAPGGAR